MLREMRRDTGLEADLLLDLQLSGDVTTGRTQLQLKQQEMKQPRPESAGA
jgi:hypothetical protein